MTQARNEGLTLLEVLAAFLIFSMVFTILVGTSQSAVKSQGLSARRLAANEVADLVMADLEIPMAQHELPIIEEEEYPFDEFVVRVRYQGFLDEVETDASGGVAGLSLGGALDATSLLAAQMPDVGKYLMRYDIEVEWQEGNTTESVRRTTFAFDWESAQLDVSGVFGGEAAAAAAAAGTSGDGEDNADGIDPSRDTDPESRSRGREGSKPSQTDREMILERMRPYL